MSKWHKTEFCENCYKEWCCSSECKYHLLHRIKETRKEIENKIYKDPYIHFTLRQRERNEAFMEVLDILDELIESEVEE